MNYPDYDPRLDTPPLTDDELASLDSLLQSLPADEVMNVEALDGYLTALLVGPVPLASLPTARWLPPVWGGDGPAESAAPFSSQKQRKRATQWVLRHLHAIHGQLRQQADQPQAPEAWQPVFSVAEDDTREWVDAEDWCAGFLQAVALAPEAWEPLFDDPMLGQALTPLVLLGGDDADLAPADAQRLADPEHRDALSRAVMDGVLALHQRLGADGSRPG